MDGAVEGENQMRKIQIGKKVSLGNKLLRRWSEFEYLIKNEWRFTALRRTSNQTSSWRYEQLLKIIFEYSHYYKKTIEKDFTIYRARDRKCKSFTNFYPPPVKNTKNQRLSPIGIPMFYGALDDKTCIAELRPTIGDIISVCTFQTTRAMVVLDFTMKRNSKVKYKKWILNFFNEFSKIISKPIGIEDSDVEYVPTQAFAEFIRSEGNYQGIIYPSAQRKGGQNIVLFSEAPFGKSQISASTIFLLPTKISHHRIRKISYESDPG